MLTSFAPELLSAILDYFSSRALLPLRLVSKAFLHLVTPRAFSDISLDLSNRNVYAQFLLLKSISTSFSTVTSSVKILRIVYLHTSHNYLSKSSTGQGNVSVLDEAVYAFLVEHLAQFIKELQNLETIHWNHHLDWDPSFSLNPIACSLSSLPRLGNVAISINGKHVDLRTHQLPPLRGFKNISSISLSCYGDIPLAYCEQEIAPVVEASPALVRFAISNFCLPVCGRTVKSCASLQSFFEKTRPELVQLELERVPLPATGLQQTLSRKLQHLSVSTPPGSRGVDFSWAELWSALKETGVKLMTLTVSGSENGIDEMYAYLLSYTGLQKLEVLGIQMDRQDLEESAGHRLWHQIVPHHKDSLTVLAVGPCYEGVWCYGPTAAAAILQCSSLRNLSLSVCQVNSSWAKAKLSRVREDDQVELRDLEEPCCAPENCVALIVCDLKTTLEKLTLKPTHEATARARDIHHLDHGTRPKGSPQLYQAMERERHIRTRIDAVLLGMRAPAAASTNWPSLVLADFLPLWKFSDPNENGTWRYQRERPASKRETEGEDGE